MRRKDLDQFWNWFSSVAASIALDVTRQDLLAELDRRVSELNAGLSWEIGPGHVAEWALTISPSMDPSLAKIASLVIENAPAVIGWQFHASRQPKDWERRFELRSGSRVLPVDASEWQYVLLRYDDGGMEIVVSSGPMPKMSESEKSEIMQVVLESELGEMVLLDPNLTYHLVDEVEVELQSKLRPLAEIRQASGAGYGDEVDK